MLLIKLQLKFKKNLQPNKRPMGRWNDRASVDPVHCDNSLMVHARIHKLKTEHHPFFINCMLSASGREPLHHYLFLFEVKSLKE